MDIPGKRLGNFSLAVRRAFVGIALAACALALFDHFFDWRLFGDGANWPIPVAFVLLFLVLRFLGPTVEQLQAHRDSLSDTKKP